MTFDTIFLIPQDNRIRHFMQNVKHRSLRNTCIINLTVTKIALRQARCFFNRYQYFFLFLHDNTYCRTRFSLEMQCQTFSMSSTHSICFCAEKNLYLAIPFLYSIFVCVEVLQPSQPSGVMSSAVSLPNHMFTGQA